MGPPVYPVSASNSPVTPVWVIVVPVEPDVYQLTVSGGVRPVMLTVSRPSLLHGGVTSEKERVCAHEEAVNAIKRTKRAIFLIIVALVITKVFFDTEVLFNNDDVSNTNVRLHRTFLNPMKQSI